MIRISQNDWRWNRKHLGPSSLTVGGHGCYITCLRIIQSKFYRYNEEHPGIVIKDPGELAGWLEFTNDHHEWGPGLVLYNEVNLRKFKEMGMEFVGRFRRWTSDDEAKVQQFCESKDWQPMIRVVRRDGGNHWLVPMGKSITPFGKGWMCINPWKGTIEKKTVGFMAPYVAIDGWALFKKRINYNEK